MCLSLSVCAWPQLHGVLRVILEPLLGNMPLVGALSLFFLKKPVSLRTIYYFLDTIVCIFA